MPEARYALGLDLGGTHLKVGLVARDGTLVRFETRGARARESRDATLEAMAEAALALGQGVEVVAVGVGCPGAVDPLTGIQQGTTPNLPQWVDVPVREWLAARLPWRVVADNDASLAALAEARCGAGRGMKSVAMVTLGTGVGGGLVLDGRLWRGAHGGAGEIGHVCVSPGGETCACGRRGCVEAYASAGGLTRRAHAALAEGCLSSLARHQLPGTEEIFSAAGQGDALAHSLVEDAVRMLAAGLAVLVHVVDPDVIVVGGGVAQVGEALLGPVRREVEGAVLDSHRGRFRVLPAELGERAGVVGAGLFAWDESGAS